MLFDHADAFVDLPGGISAATCCFVTEGPGGISVVQCLLVFPSDLTAILYDNYGGVGVVLLFSNNLL